MSSKRRGKIDAFLSDLVKLRPDIARCDFINSEEMEKMNNWLTDKYVKYTTRKLRKILPSLIQRAQDYNKWLKESKQIINSERSMIFQKPKYKGLSDRFTKFRKGDFDSIVLGGMYVYLILDGSVNVANCEDFMYQHYGRDCKAKDNTDTLRDFLASGGFYSFVKLLEETQKRPPIERFRESRKQTLEVLDQIEGVLKK